MSDMGAPASSYATAGPALRTLWPRKPRHNLKVGIPSAGGVAELMNDKYKEAGKRSVDREIWLRICLNISNYISL
jgi:hypothetical protein